MELTQKGSLSRRDTKERFRRLTLLQWLGFVRHSIGEKGVSSEPQKSAQGFPTGLL